jgi:hypothetical protein
MRVSCDVLHGLKRRGLDEMERIDQGGGFSVLDGAALVVGAAIASVHVLGIRRVDLAGPGWIMIVLTFCWIAMTAAGPFLYLARRFIRKLPGYPKIGDRLWALLGLPWLGAALLQSATPGSEPRHNPLFSATLIVGLGVVCLVALIVVWSSWVLVPPEQAAKVEAAPWTNRLGLILSIAWPIQCGLGMVVLS